MVQLNKKYKEWFNLKITDKDLKEKVKIFNNKDVVIIFDDINKTNNEINLNIVSAYIIDLTENVLHIGLDNSLDFEIRLK